MTRVVHDFLSSGLAGRGQASRWDIEKGVKGEGEGGDNRDILDPVWI